MWVYAIWLLHLTWLSVFVALVFSHKFSWNTKYNMLYIDNPVGIFFILGLDVCLSSADDNVVSDASARLIPTHTGRPVKNGRRKVVIVVVVELSLFCLLACMLKSL